MKPHRSPATSPARRRAARICTSLERLEDRAVPAVGALGLVEADVLTIVGDDTDNTIIVRQEGGNLSIDGGQFVTASGVSSTIGASSIRSFLVLGGAGNDTILVDSDVKIPGVIEGGDGDDVLVSGGGSTDLFGGSGNDALYGRGGADRLYGEDGDDTLSGGGGRDVAYGGAGSDTFTRSVESARDATSADATRAADSATPGLPATATPAAAPALGAFRQPTVLSATLSGDVLTIQGTASADKIALTLADGSYALADGTAIRTADGTATSVDASRVREVVVLGYDGDDTIDLSAARAATRIVGGAGNDTLTGGSGADSIFGGSGSDTIASGAGDDVVYGDSGADAIDLGSGNDVAYGGAGTDTIAGGTGRDRAVDAALDQIAADVEQAGADAAPATNPFRPRRRRGGFLA